MGSRSAEADVAAMEVKRKEKAGGEVRPSSRHAPFSKSRRSRIEHGGILGQEMLREFDAKLKQRKGTKGVCLLSNGGRAQARGERCPTGNARMKVDKAVIER